ncbi:MAG: hypothetical protein U0798_06840 [Gemmataceae bacterium]
MPWFIWMCFLTVPVLVGVACTLASDKPDDPKGINTVFLTAGIWLFVAYHLKNYLRDATPKKWVRWWVVLTIVLPLVAFFILSLRKDAGIQRILQSRAEVAERIDRTGLAASAPSKRMLSWAETKEVVSRVQPHAVHFAIKLLTSIPPAWWFIAFGVGLWRGK